MAEMTLFSNNGERLYLNQKERDLFEEAAKTQKREIMTLALVLLYTGCRISEALNLQFKHIDLSNKSIIIDSLKKRKKKEYRSIPVPDKLLDYLELVHEISRSKNKNLKIWNIARNTAFLQIKKVFKQADISGSNSNPKALRHSFGVHALVSKVDITTLQRWLGHSHVSTTAIYANAQGEEERLIAKRMWKQ